MPPRKRKVAEVAPSTRSTRSRMASSESPETSGASASDNHDWNVLARSFVTYGNTGHVITYDGDEPPCSEDEISSFITRHKLRVGDVVSFSEERSSDSYIAVRDVDTGRMSWVRNPDDSGSGYLTIPSQALENVTDFKGKYQDQIKDSPEVNFHISAKDRFITDKLGADIPEGWKFNVSFTWGELDYVSFTSSESAKSVTVATPGDFEKWTIQDLKDKLEATTTSGGEGKKFGIKVHLQGDQLQAYKAIHTTGASAYSWIAARPKLPPGWTVEPGGMAAGDEYRWIWKLAGPQKTEESAKICLREFFGDAEFKYVDYTESNVM